MKGDANGPSKSPSAGISSSSRPASAGSKGFAKSSQPTALQLSRERSARCGKSVSRSHFLGGKVKWNFKVCQRRIASNTPGLGDGCSMQEICVHVFVCVMCVFEYLQDLEKPQLGEKKKTHIAASLKSEQTDVETIRSTHTRTE